MVVALSFASPLSQVASASFWYPGDRGVERIALHVKDLGVFRTEFEVFRSTHDDLPHSFIGRMAVVEEDGAYGLNEYNSAIFGTTLTILTHGGDPYAFLPVNGQWYPFSSSDTWSNKDALGDRPGQSAFMMLQLPETSVPSWPWYATHWANSQGVSWTNNPLANRCPDYGTMRQGAYSDTGTGGQMVFWVQVNLGWQPWWGGCQTSFTTQYSWTSPPLP